MLVDIKNFSRVKITCKNLEALKQMLNDNIYQRQTHNQDSFKLLGGFVQAYIIEPATIFFT